ncbi:hypothetical protein [Streptomyces enissocaesilis]|uniref:Lipoprotein n=1 Tax=Streptomyces enissocaesilis TaxID=332589 RepID=A0ABN3WQ85_9ACTN
MKRRNRTIAPLTALLAAAAFLAAGCGTGTGTTSTGTGSAASTTGAPRTDARPGAPAHQASGGKAGRVAPDRSASPQRRPLLRLPGLGPKTLARVPGRTRQALVVTGEGRDENRGTAVLYERDRPGAPWRPGTSWPTHNGLRGWTDKHVHGDLRSPIGVFTLTDAGGLLPDPGTKLSYDQGPAFTARGTGSLGEPLTGSFDYVIAIDYNREPGTTPLDWTRPLGAARGGGIWLHVDHDGPTQGCVSLRKDVMKHLLRTIDPVKNPVVVMGDAASLRD